MLTEGDPFSGIFATKDILPKDAGKDSVIRTTLRELLIYVSFVAVVSVREWEALMSVSTSLQFISFILLSCLAHPRVHVPDFRIACDTVSFSAMNPTMYYQTKILSELFLDKQFSDGSGRSFRTASQMDHFWKVCCAHTCCPK
jgi:hypothetical protein